ncbi:hypothetical protein C8R43DRAFT_1089512 [Mycena crocata]|nr:hypothetical protein C8R43DRAFT_1089512 [Mycena crocata]
MMDGNQFFDADRNEIFFSAGAEESGLAHRQELLDGIKNLDYYDHTVFGKMQHEDSTVSDAVNAMAEMAQLTKDANVKTTRHISALDNEFYMNHPAELLALDWANPLVREYMQVYPEITNHISELNHADKWIKEVDLDELSPMWADWEKAGNKHFYIKELAQLKNGNFVIPMQWVIYDKEEFAEVYSVIHYPQSNCFVIHDEEMIKVKATDLQYNYIDLQGTGYSLNFPENSPAWAQNMPNPVRKIADGRPVFSIRIVPWSDDVSGNVSKQFNPHMNVYMVNSCLPHRKVTQECFIRFCSTSPHASSGEQAEALAEDLGPDQYHKAYDCKLEEEILFRIFAHVLPADNPQQAESASNAGVHSNFWCRYDKAGGTAAHRETDDGYSETIRTIKRQIWVACSGVQDAVDEIQTSTGVKDKTAFFLIAKLIVKVRETQKEHFKFDPRLRNKKLKGDARKAVKTRIKDLIQWELYNWVILQPESRSSKLPQNSEDRHQLCPGDHYNILLSLRGLDPHRDSPCEILHSILLGDDKYIWHETNSVWDKTKGDKFAVRLQSSSVDGFNLPSLRGQYIVKYKNALIGKHFKVLQQLGAFHMHEDLCGKNLFELWKASGELGALLWFPEIRNREQYLRDLQVCIDNVLNLWGIDPARIMTKYKLHVLPHLPDDVLRFGPPILYATEGFEGWNSVFHLCSILSNHQAPSHDIGVTLADMERFKHQASGGWWKPAGSQEYVQAGRDIVSFLHKNKELQRRLGWMDKSKPKPGSIKLDARTKAVSAPWCDVLGRTWTTCKFVVAQTGDICKKLSWIFFKGRDDGPILTGRICLIVIPANSPTKHSEAVGIVHKFVVSTTRDARMNMPSAKACVELTIYKGYLHDCYGKRRATARTQTAINHADTNIYLVNMHSLHNAHLLRDTLPRSLTAPLPYFEDHNTKRKEFAALVRISGPKKCAAAQQKSKETWEKNKKAKEANENIPAVGLGDGSERGEDNEEEDQGDENDEGDEGDENDENNEDHNEDLEMAK